MSKRIDLLRLDYAFSVVVPCLMAVYFNDLDLFYHLDVIAGFFCFAITGNLLNDAIDARDPSDEETVERVRGFHWKEIAAMAVLSFLFGTFLFARTVTEHPVNGLILAVIVAMVVVYCVKLKPVPIVNQVLLGASHVLLPYLMVKVDAGLPSALSGTDWVLLATFFAYAFTGQVVHEVIDGDAITRFSLKAQQRVIWVASVVTIAMGLFAWWYVGDYYFLPFVFIPLGTMYTFRRPTRSTKGVKDVGIVLGNLILFYFLVLVLRKQFLGA
ncbi:MAG: hypothetical protein Kow0069_14100 [Promethearchaeota archaeon]